MQNGFVVIENCDSYEMAESTMEKLLAPFELAKIIKKGSRVAVKLNLVTMLKPEKAATTHPALVKALCSYINKLGATAVLGDSPGGVYTELYLNSVYSATGIKDLCKSGLVYTNNNFDYQNVEYPDAMRLKKFCYTSWLTECDYIINFAKLKSHGMMGMSASVKNMFGSIPGTMKPEYHYRFPDPMQFAEMLIDINEFFKPILNIIDGVIGMEGNGPTAGTPKKIGMIAASHSPYTLDAVCAEIIGLSINDVKTLEAAKIHNLCPERIETNTDIESFKINDFKTVTGKKSIEFYTDAHSLRAKILAKAARTVLKTIPKIYEKKCVSCGKCSSLCPAKAINVNSKKPHINRKKCIRCFCCQEFCPVGAINAERTFIAKIVLKTVK